MRHIPESEYRRYTERRRKELAEAIAASGLRILDIARGTRMKWQTVQRIANGQSVREESQDRVRCFLESYNQSTHEKDTN